MNPADAFGRRSEVMAAFLEGWRKQHILGKSFTTDREAWLGSLAYGRLAYGVFPPCPRCRCQLVNPYKGNPPPCMKCGAVRAFPIERPPCRLPEKMEAMVVARILGRSLDQLGDDRDAFPDQADYPDRESPFG